MHEDLYQKTCNLAKAHQLAFQWYYRKHQYFQIPYVVLNLATIVSVYFMLERENKEIIRYVCIATIFVAHFLRIVQSKYAYNTKAQCHESAYRRLQELLSKNIDDQTLVLAQIKHIRSSCSPLPPYLLVETIRSSRSSFDMDVFFSENLQRSKQPPDNPSGTGIRHIGLQGGIQSLQGGIQSLEGDIQSFERNIQSLQGDMTRPNSDFFSQIRKSRNDVSFSSSSSQILDTRDKALAFDFGLLERVAVLSFAHYMASMHFSWKYNLLYIPTTILDGLAILTQVYWGDEPMVFAVTTSLDVVMQIFEDKLQFYSYSKMHETASEAFSVLADDIYTRYLSEESNAKSAKESVSVFESIQNSSPPVPQEIVDFMFQGKKRRSFLAMAFCRNF